MCNYSRVHLSRATPRVSWTVSLQATSREPKLPRTVLGRERNLLSTEVMLGGGDGNSMGVGGAIAASEGAATLTAG